MNEFNFQSFGTPVENKAGVKPSSASDFDFSTFGTQSEVKKVEPIKTGYEKTLDIGSKIVDFLGGKSVADTFGAEIAKFGATQDEQKYITQPSVKQTAGSALQLGSLFIPVGEIASAIGLGARAIGIGAKTAKVVGNVLAGAGTGALMDVGQKLETGQTSGLGTALGGGIPLAAPLVGAAGKLAGKAAVEAIGKLTGAGAGAIQEGLRASIAGGERAKIFTKALRGAATPDSIVEEARNGLSQIISNRSKSFAESLSKIAESKQSLDIKPLFAQLGENLQRFNIGVAQDGSLDFARSALAFNPSAQKEVAEIVNVMKDYGLREGDRTAEQLHRLKVAFGDLYSQSSQARAFVESMRKTTRSILSQVPKYDEMAKKFEDSTELITDIRKGLSLGDKASVDTAFKKLTSVLRQNNEFRQQLVSELDNVTGGYLSSKIAGQQLAPLAPRGLQGVLTGAGGVVGLSTGVGIIPLIQAALLTSPRVTGELLRVLGATGRKAKSIAQFLTPKSALFPGDIAKQGIVDDINTAKQLISEAKANSNPQSGSINLGADVGKGSPAVGETALINEAKKYKSAEEFVKKYGGKTYFHTTSTDVAPLIEKNGFISKVGERSLGTTKGNGVFLYEDIKPTETFGKNFIWKGKTPTVIETKINGKIFNSRSRSQSINSLAEDTTLITRLKNEGYVGIRGVENGTPVTFVFEPKSIKTKSQLSEIWSKAKTTN